VERWGVEAVFGTPVLDAGFAVRAAYLQDVYQTVNTCLALNGREIMKWEGAGRRMAYRELAFSGKSKLPQKQREFLAQLINAGAFD